MMILAQIEWSKLFELKVAIRVAMLIGLGFPGVVFASSLAARSAKRKLSAQGAMLLRKGIFYVGTTIIILQVLHQLNFQLGALLGAAGIVGIALGFASQTSVSNIISGLFLISEHPFEVGDQIRVGDTTGIVLSIDLLSVKLRTFDNQLVRMPNENLIKTQVNNLTHFPIRRLDINVSVAYKEDVNLVKGILLDIAKDHPHILDEPEPLVLFQDFGDSALQFLFAVWSVKEDFLILKKTVRELIKARFDAAGIEIPFPHRSLYAGTDTAPFPIRIVSETPGAAASVSPTSLT
ncbi:MAG: mechanosensitive ion channel family protein [Phycisphaerae bacterium]|nr:mechanosensitive ion channel family protein [Phycisphaerae bacterium]